MTGCHEALAAAGFRADKDPNPIVNKKIIIEVSTGQYFGHMNAHEAWEFLARLADRDEPPD